MAGRSAPITLITDFGGAEPFAGVMKGVILGIHPDAVIVDLTHEVPPQDIESGAYHLSNAWRHFPRGTVHVVIVDPGVGTSRRALAVSAGDHFFLAPDNGVLSPILGSVPWNAVMITAAHYLLPSPSPTFHGRDIFAPAAAHLSRGTILENLGEPVTDPILIELPPALVEDGVIRARVLHIDRFGNLVLNVEGSHLAMAASPGRATLAAEIAGRRIEKFVTHYAAAGGEICFLINSDGRLEIALPGGSAAAALGLGRGASVLVKVR